MTAPFLAPALVTLRDETNRQFPNRDHASDGWLGDASHQARPSDHNPCWTCSGRLYAIVRALDTDINPDGDSKRDLRREILEAAIGDPRVWYVISNGIIYSRTYGWTPRRYIGSNGHYEHVHISLRYGVGEFDTHSWLDDPLPKIKAKPVWIGAVRREFGAAIDGKAVKFNNGVGRIQQALNRQNGETLTVDGEVGPATLAAWRRWEQKVGVAGQARMPDLQTLRPLARGRFAIKGTGPKQPDPKPQHGGVR